MPKLCDKKHSVNHTSLALGTLLALPHSVHISFWCQTKTSHVLRLCNVEFLPPSTCACLFGTFSPLSTVRYHFPLSTELDHSPLYLQSHLVHEELPPQVLLQRALLPLQCWQAQRQASASVAGVQHLCIGHRVLCIKCTSSPDAADVPAPREFGLTVDQVSLLCSLASA